VFGNGLHFDGIDDYVNAGNSTSLNFTTAMTAGAWIKTTDSMPTLSVKDMTLKNNSIFISAEASSCLRFSRRKCLDWAITVHRS